MKKKRTFQLIEGGYFEGLFILRGIWRCSEDSFKVLLGDRRGGFYGFLSFQNGERILRKGRVYYVKGRFDEGIATFFYLKEVENESFFLSEFDPIGEKERRILLKKLEGMVSSIEKEEIRVFLKSFLKDEGFMKKFSFLPGSLLSHHPYPGGLLSHTVSVMEIAEPVDRCTNLDRDILLAGAFVHDIGKVRTYEVDFSLTLEGRYLGHVPLGIFIVRERIKKLSLSDELFFSLSNIILNTHLPRRRGRIVGFGKPTNEARIIRKIDEEDAERARSGSDLALGVF
jgi:3'-5' exoribonuclease